MSAEVASVLVGVLIFAATIWVGGCVTVVIVARVAQRTMPTEVRVAFFREFGHWFGLITTAALIVAYGTGAALVYGRAWDAALTATAVVATALVGATGIGVAQARRMTRQRRAAIESPQNRSVQEAVRRGARSAALLRGAIGVLSFALLALGVLVGT